MSTLYCRGDAPHVILNVLGDYMLVRDYMKGAVAFSYVLASSASATPG